MSLWLWWWWWWWWCCEVLNELVGRMADLLLWVDTTDMREKRCERKEKKGGQREVKIGWWGKYPYICHACISSRSFYTPHLRTHEVLCTWHFDDGGYMDKEEGKEKKKEDPLLLSTRNYHPLIVSFPSHGRSTVILSTSIFALFHIYPVSCEIYKVMMTWCF